jgi:membrane associated rhomboid family serine protease/Zn-finger nucleic acid-binding protein
MDGRTARTDRAAPPKSGPIDGTGAEFIPYGLARRYDRWALSDRPDVSAQCPTCGLHELVPVRLARGAGGNWRQVDGPRLFRRAPPPRADLEVVIDTCPACMGAWFDAGELDVLSGDLGDITEILDDDERPARRVCPLGHGPMGERDLPGIISTPVDRCRTCGGMWLDGHERRKLARATTSEGQGTRTERWLKRGAIWAAQVITNLPVEVDNPARGTPWVVFGIIATLMAVFLLQIQGAVDTAAWGMMAGRVFAEGDWWTVGTYTLVHATWIHILGNIYFLYTFGDNIEHLFGRWRFLAFYLAAGLIGGAAHLWLTQKTAMLVVGASGCVSGVLAAYLWAFPRASLFQVILWIQVKVPVWVYLFVWVGFHVLMGLYGGKSSEGTAWWAHLGGFVLGLAVTPWVLRWRRREVARRVKVPNPKYAR